jgi:hypothetical protein
MEYLGSVLLRNLTVVVDKRFFFRVKFATEYRDILRNLRVVVGGFLPAKFVTEYRKILRNLRVVAESFLFSYEPGNGISKNHFLEKLVERKICEKTNNGISEDFLS